MIIDEPITLEQYNPEWVTHYKDAASQLLPIFKNIKGIEHIGSTAIEGMLAKPIIDILIGVEEVVLADDQIKALENVGYEYLGEAGVPGRLHFRKRKGLHVNMSIVKFESTLWNNNIKFRDHLRKNKDDARKYAEQKLKIFNEGHQRLLAYSKEKEPIISMILKFSYRNL